MPSALCQLADVKTHLAIDNTDDDVVLADFITEACGQIERYCNRTFAQPAIGSEIYQHFGGNERVIHFDRFPIKEPGVISWEIQYPGEDWQDISVTQYVNNFSSGLIELTYPIGTELDRCRALYSGGYIMPGNTPSIDETALPEELELAAIRQTIYNWTRRFSDHTDSVSGPGGSVSVKGEDINPRIIGVLDHYKRRRFG